MRKLTCEYDQILSYLSVAFFFKLRKVRSVLTEGQVVLSHPLAGVLSSLSSDLRHSCRPSKVHLQPLVAVVVTCRPGSSPCSGSSPVQPGVCGSVVSVPTGSSRQLIGTQTSVLQPKWFVTSRSYKKNTVVSLCRILRQD